MGLYLGHKKHMRLLLCGSPVGVPRCRNFAVYVADNDSPRVLHMVFRRVLACNFLQNSFSAKEIENVEGIVGSSHVCPQNQNNAKICPKLYTRAETRH